MRAIEEMSASRLEPRHFQVDRGPLRISTDPASLDRAVIRRFLASSYWSHGIGPEIVDRALSGSLNFGLYEGEVQIGLARVVSDFATFAYLCDVFVLEGRRGHGLGSWLIEVVLQHPDLQGLRRWLLVTRDAQELYSRFGFRSLAAPEKFMEIHAPEIYRREPTEGSEG